MSCSVVKCPPANDAATAVGWHHPGRPWTILPPEKQGDQYGAKFVYPKTPVGDNVVCTHVHEVYKGMNNKGKEVTESNGILFIGEKGKLFVNRGYAVCDPEGIMKEPISEGDKHLQKVADHRGNWLDCIKTRQKPICDVAIGAGSVTVCHLVNLAYWNHKKLTWNPQTWEFPGDA